MKILSIDGGGIRGIIPALLLAKIEEITEQPISSLFDLIAGTSTGGLIALALAVDNGMGTPKHTAKELVELYKTKGHQIFNRSTWHRIRSVGNTLDEKYPNNGLIEIVEEYFGRTTLKNTLTEVVIPTYETERRIPWLFKSINAKNSNKIGYDFKLRDVALATSAAPTYFEPHKVPYGENDYLSFIDGGVYANNPALCAYADAKSMFHKKDKEITLISLGTGQLTRRLYHGEIKNWGLINWAQPVLSCVFDGVSDTVDYQLSKILPDGHYYRFQTELNEGNDDMDDASEANIRVLQLEAENLIYDNSRLIDRMVKAICE